MSNNSIEKIPTKFNQDKIVTFESVSKDMVDWRDNKVTLGQKIPDDIWKDIFILIEKFPKTNICGAFNITNAQLRAKIKENDLQKDISIEPENNNQHLKFVEIKPAPENNSYYKPEKIPATNTLVVEFCRADGRIMKIHTTTDSFAELMRAFFGRE